MENLPHALYSAAQVRELDRIAIEECGIPGFELMSRAGEALFQQVKKKCQGEASMVVFCGGGNNAGDGYVVAALALKAGWKARIYAVAEPDSLQGAALEACQTYRKTGGEVFRFQSGITVDADVIVDALLGTGLDRPVTGAYAEAIELINSLDATVFAADIPSGLNADTGGVMGSAVKADVTVTFIALKQGLFTGSAAEYCGEIAYSSLSVPMEIYHRVASKIVRVLPKPLAPRHRCAHKGDMGHVLIVGGDVGYSGAARMAGEAALRVGAGLVSIATRAEQAPLMNVGRPELMCRGVETADSLSALLVKADVVVLGPGLGQGAWGKTMFAAVMASDKLMVVDADGLNGLAGTDLTRSAWILTPHPGEAARLLGTTTQAIQQDRFRAVSKLQQRYGGIAVLKGAGTLIASGATVGVSNAGNPGMASGGMGDVLTGVIGALLAQGLSLQDAAEQGVYLHGLAADLAAAKDGERGLLASDLLPYLRQAVN